MWSTAGGAQRLHPEFSDTSSERRGSVGERLGDAFEDGITVEVFEPAPQRQQPPALLVSFLDLQGKDTPEGMVARLAVFGPG